MVFNKIQNRQFSIHRSVLYHSTSLHLKKPLQYIQCVDVYGSSQWFNILGDCHKWNQRICATKGYGKIRELQIDIYWESRSHFKWPKYPICWSANDSLRQTETKLWTHPRYKIWSCRFQSNNLHKAIWNNLRAKQMCMQCNNISTLE